MAACLETSSHYTERVNDKNLTAPDITFKQKRKIESLQDFIVSKPSMECAVMLGAANAFNHLRIFDLTSHPGINNLLKCMFSSATQHLQKMS